MGNGISRSNTVDTNAVAERVDELPPLELRDSVLLVSVMPEDPALKRKGEVLLLEVSSEGLRLLQPVVEFPVGRWPWAQIHSWASGPVHFTFKHFDEGKRSVQQTQVELRDVKAVLAHIKVVIDSILVERKKQQISCEAFEQLLERVKATDDSVMQLELLKTADSMFSSTQGKQVLDLLPTTFDKVEAAAVLHSKLIDQNCFTFMLDALECAEDRNNVWHRITQLRRQQC